MCRAVSLHAKQAQKGERNIGIPILDAGAIKWCIAQCHAPALLPPEIHPVPTVMEALCALGLVWTVTEIYVLQQCLQIHNELYLNRVH
jgi:hypothetical protein